MHRHDVKFGKYCGCGNALWRDTESIRSVLRCVMLSCHFVVCWCWCCCGVGIAAAVVVVGVVASDIADHVAVKTVCRATGWPHVLVRSFSLSQALSVCDGWAVLHTVLTPDEFLLNRGHLKRGASVIYYYVVSLHSAQNTR